MPHGTGAAPGLAVATAPPAWCDTAGRSGRQPGPVAAPAGVIASRNAATAAEPVPIAPRSTAGGSLHRRARVSNRSDHARRTLLSWTSVLLPERLTRAWPLYLPSARLPRQLQDSFELV